MTFLFLFTRLHCLCFCNGCGLLQLLVEILGVTTHFKSLSRNVSGAQAGGGSGSKARRLLSDFSTCFLHGVSPRWGRSRPPQGGQGRSAGRPLLPKTTGRQEAGPGLRQVCLPAWALGGSPGGSRSGGSAPREQGIKTGTGVQHTAYPDTLAAAWPRTPPALCEIPGSLTGARPPTRLHRCGKRSPKVGTGLELLLSRRALDILSHRCPGSPQV